MNTSFDRVAQARRWMLKSLIYLDMSKDEPNDIRPDVLEKNRDKAEACIIQAAAALNGESFQRFGLGE